MQWLRERSKERRWGAKEGRAEGEVSRLLLAMWAIGIALLAATSPVRCPGASSHCKQGTEQLGEN